MESRQQPFDAFGPHRGRHAGPTSEEMPAASAPVLSKRDRLMVSGDRVALADAPLQGLGHCAPRSRRRDTSATSQLLTLSVAGMPSTDKPSAWRLRDPGARAEGVNTCPGLGSADQFDISGIACPKSLIYNDFSKTVGHKTATHISHHTAPAARRAATDSARDVLSIRLP